MGTRSLILVLYKGRFVIAQHTQFDGYPDGEGLEVLKFLLFPTNIKRLEDGLSYIYIPSDDELREIWENVTMLENEIRANETSSEAHQSLLKGPMDVCWPSLSRNTRAKILKIVAQATDENPIPIQLDLEFANDGLFCEWAYVINLDDCVFEVFCGSEPKAKARSTRFYDIGGELILSLYW
jgi:hypothetical protein